MAAEEANAAPESEDEPPSESMLKFDGISLKDVDQDKFKDELRQRFVENGLSSSQSKKIQIELRAGSVCAVMRGPSSVLSTVGSIDPSKLHVMGCVPKAMAWLAEHALSLGQDLAGGAASAMSKGVLAFA